MEVCSWNGYWRFQQAWFLVGWHVWKLNCSFLGGKNQVSPFSFCGQTKMHGKIQTGDLLEYAWNVPCSIGEEHHISWQGESSINPRSIVSKVRGAIRLGRWRLARQTPSFWRLILVGKGEDFRSSLLTSWSSHLVKLFQIYLIGFLWRIVNIWNCNYLCLLWVGIPI